jgi:hypothetical protein
MTPEEQFKYRQEDLIDTIICYRDEIRPNYGLIDLYNQHIERVRKISFPNFNALDFQELLVDQWLDY